MSFKKTSSVHIYTGTPDYKDFFDPMADKNVDASLLLLTDDDDVYLVAYDLEIDQTTTATATANRIPMVEALPENAPETYTFQCGSQRYTVNISNPLAPTVDLLDPLPPGNMVANLSGDIKIYLLNNFLFEVNGMLQGAIPDVAEKHNVLLLKSPNHLFLVTTVVNRGEIVIDRLDIARALPEQLDLVTSMPKNPESSYQVSHDGFEYTIDISNPDQPTVNRSSNVLAGGFGGMMSKRNTLK